tara:strand:- start:528 stop:815 length:288 start_codon:yes stop_codon:yes gene_type:complete
MEKYKRYPKLNKLLTSLVRERTLTPLERLCNRLGYMGTGFLMMSPYLLVYDNIGVYTYLIGALLSIPQVWLARQWNLVALHTNLLVGYGFYLYNV